MKRLVDRTVWALLRQQKMGDFIQTGTEVCFDGGKIDRIDTCEEENQVYVKVTDYKTGSKAFDMTAFYYGLQLQLAVYLNAALELEKKKHPNKEIIPAGIFYYQMKDPMVEKTEEDQVQDALFKRASSVRTCQFGSGGVKSSGSYGNQKFIGGSVCKE